MLTEITRDMVLAKAEYKVAMPALRNRLTDLQQRVRAAGLPVVIVFEGWGAGGKGTQISRLVGPLDPRYFDVRTTGKVTEEKTMRPFLWSYWTYLPPGGQIVIMDKSWHRLILPGVRDLWKLNSAEQNSFYPDVNAFERQIVADGTLVIKLFLHISKDEQSRRFAALGADPNTSWRVSPHDLEQNKNYEKNRKQFEKLLKMTHTQESPWHIIEADNKNYATVKMYQTIISAIEDRMGYTYVPETPWQSVNIPRTLENISPDEDITNDDYRARLEYYQERMKKLTNKMYSKRRSAVVVYEGWDAAGKGGNIKRLTSEIDPRAYTVVPIGPPRPYELARQYLWRFMVKMPKDGHLTIFDRSWYGRVLVERVDKLTPPEVWARAYREINEMEQHLTAHGVVLLKLWLHIDKDEQLRRFEGRQSDPLKHHKITMDDWHNREKWDYYVDAVDEMLHRTHTAAAPWIIVESNSKKYARIKVLKTVTDALEEALK